MNASLATFMYLIAGMLFILSLRGVSSPATSRQGNRFGMIGMALAVVTTLASRPPSSIGSWIFVILGIGIGGAVGARRARAVKMADTPRFVALLHALVGMAAVLVAAGAAHAPQAFGIGESRNIPAASTIELSIGLVTGAITFSGSLIAFLKLGERLYGGPIVLPHRHILNGGLFFAIVVLAIAFIASQSLFVFWLIALCSFALGALVIVPVSDADMRVVASMLNSYAGWAVAGIGFALGNLALIMTGALVGSSGAILSYIMCKGTNRSLISVIFGGETAGA